MKLTIMGTNFCLTIILLLIISTAAVSASRDLASNGTSDVIRPSYIRIPSMKSTENCEQTYGFMPCTTSALGNFFLIVAFGYLMFSGALHLSNGAELLLEIVGPGIVAGLFLPLLGAIPDGTLILVSGLSGSIETAQNKVSVGMGMLAGSTIMLLTVIWGSCVLVGKCDLDVDSRAIDETDTKGFHLKESGVSADIWTSYAARVMTLSVIPFLVVQLQQAFNSSSGTQFVVLVSFTISLVMLIAYCAYQVSQRWIQKRRLDYVKHKRVMTGFFTHVKKHMGSLIINPNGTLNKEVIEKFFHEIDQNNDGVISKEELRGLVIAMRLEWMREGNESNLDGIVQTIMDEFDKENPDGEIDLSEFIKGIEQFHSCVKGNKVYRQGDTHRVLKDYEKVAEEEHFLLGDYGSGDEIGEEIEDVKATTIKAIWLIILGTILTVAFADPLVDAVDSFSVATNIPSFFVSFIALPLITNSKGAVSVISFASKKKRRSAALAFCELYGEVTMGNLVGLSVILALVYTRALPWDFSAEVLIVFLVCLIMGTLTSFRTSFPLWTSVMAFSLCPLSLMLVYVLNNLFGWS